MQYRKGGSIGSSIMVRQQQTNHQKKLNSIYNRSKVSQNVSENSSTKYSCLHNNYSKKERYDDQMHLKTIRKLVQSLNKGKTMADRIKDPHDFFAYPALFFRQIAKTSIKQVYKKQKHLKRVKSQVYFNQDSTKISQEKIKQFLPILTDFEQSDFEEFTDGINKIIINFNIITKDELRTLEQKVIKLLPKRCPKEFKTAIGMMFDQIDKQTDE